MKLFYPILLLIGLILFPSSGQAAASSTPSLGPLTVLVGEWQATDPEGKPVTAVYRLASSGTSLEETLTMGEEPGMTTMYHSDGKGLMATHYCSLGNQPRMRTGPLAPDATTVSFDFVDATNLKSQDDLHIHSVQFVLRDENHVIQTWGWREQGKEKKLVLDLQRVR